MGRKAMIFGLAMMLAVGFSAVASAATTEEVLDKMAKQNGAVTTTEFDMKTEMKGKQEGGVMLGHMCMQAVQKDGKRGLGLMNMKQTMTMGEMKHEMLMVHDGEFIWNEMKDPMSGRVMVMKMKPDPSGVKNDPSQFRDQYDLKLVGEEEFDGQKMWVLEGTPKPGAAPAGGMGPAAQQPGKIRMSVGQTDGFVHRWILYAKDGSEMGETQLTNIKLNGKLDPALFKYTPPPGAQVMDMTKGMPRFPMGPN